LSDKSNEITDGTGHLPERVRAGKGRSRFVLPVPEILAGVIPEILAGLRKETGNEQGYVRGV